MKIKINKKNYEAKYTIRAFFTFEQLTGKEFKVENKLDEYIFMYRLIIANNPDELLTLNEFISACDKDLNIALQIQKIMVEAVQFQAQFLTGKSKESDKKKA